MRRVKYSWSEREGQVVGSIKFMIFSLETYSRWHHCVHLLAGWWSRFVSVLRHELLAGYYMHICIPVRRLYTDDIYPLLENPKFIHFRCFCRLSIIFMNSFNYHFKKTIFVLSNHCFVGGHNIGQRMHGHANKSRSSSHRGSSPVECVKLLF